MRRTLAGMLIGVAALLAAGFAGPATISEDTAAGIGSFHFGKEGTGVAFFDFSVTHGSRKGSFVLGAEDHHYPEVVIRTHSIDSVKISGNKVFIKGKGALQDHPVVFRIVATDGTNGQPDHFKIDADPAHGYGDQHEEFHAEGPLFRGNIRVGLTES